jgi:Flp pilus assembly protein TadD
MGAGTVENKNNNAMIGVSAGLAVIVLAGGWWFMRGSAPAAAPTPVPRPPSETKVSTSTPDVIARADEMQRNGKPESAAIMLQVYLNSHADDNAARLRYAAGLGVTKDFDEAIRQYQTVLKNDPDNVTAQIGIARMTSWKNDLPRALQLYDEVLKTRPNNYDARVGKAYTLMWMRRTDEARALFQAAAKQAPNDPDVAEALRKLGRK